jgi:phage tail sheath protein FI
MPEYLSPGVYIEEIPSSLRAIEGVSTSTAAFVGRASQGTVPGSKPPFTLPAGSLFLLTPDPSPVLVTSFAEFQREFGAPLPIPLPTDTNDYGYLGWAVKAFFDNGGQRAYIARVTDATDTASKFLTQQGMIYRLMRSAAKGDKTLYLTSTRGLKVGEVIKLVRHSDGQPAATSVTVDSWNAVNNSVTVTTALSAALDASDVYGHAGALPSGNKGPTFFARSTGSWSSSLQIQISPSDRAAVPILATASLPVGAVTLQVQNISSFYVGGAVEISYDGVTRSSHQITAINTGSRQVTIAVATTHIINPAATPAPTIRTLEIDITIVDGSGAAPPEIYRGLSWVQQNVTDLRKHYAWVINANSGLVWVEPPALAADETVDFTTQPTTVDGFPMLPTTDGSETYVSNDDTYIGDDLGPGERSGIQSLLDLTDARIIAVPGNTSPAVQLELIAQCELARYRFAVLDGELDPAGGGSLPSVSAILAHSSLYDTSFAAYYQPWFQITVDSQARYLPPSGYLAGIYARVDNARGVWKAPANEPVQNILGLKTNFTKGEQDILNPRGVNLTRRFDVGGIRVWGARTLSSDTSLMYINVRRTLIFLEASIDSGTQWVVFEPNTQDTWARLTASVNAFLLTQLRNGALFGVSPEDAYFVRCDETTMTADDIQNGRLICQIGVSIARPAEFVIFQIQQITGFGATS